MTNLILINIELLLDLYEVLIIDYVIYGIVSLIIYYNIFVRLYM
jgi:hypothetical protein